ncbi:hypothetical protein [Nonomuraea sp. NPDC049309]|uniref:aromatic-ring hydroxylase C-terminal domain-containing protein n=1 Tax=Nonomuraea sp. NPDC049309 TaxID=3364350 RepID=UPI0037126683
MLDTYESERREFARRTLLQARAQAAIDRAEGETGEALRALLAEVFAFEGPARHLATLLHDAGVRYPSGEGAHPLAGRFVPDLALHGGRRVAELMREARPVLLDLGGGAALDDDWVRVVRASCDDPPADTLLIRPDGYVAWAGADGVEAAAEHWFGRAGTRAESVV